MHDKCVEVLICSPLFAGDPCTERRITAEVTLPVFVWVRVIDVIGKQALINALFVGHPSFALFAGLQIPTFHASVTCQETVQTHLATL